MTQSSGPVRTSGVHRFFAALALVGVLLAPEARATVQPTGSMAAPRSEHTATFLGTGKVLVAGGTNSTGRLATAELFDPATGSFAATAPMPEARNGHTATLLPNGKVLVVGGNGDAGALATCRLFDPRTGAWASTGSMATARREHTATLLANGKVLVAGGQNGTAPGYTALSSAELYSPATGTWAATGALGSARSGHAAALLEDGKVLVAGGQTKWFPLPALYTSTAYLYDPTTGTWSATGSMGTARRSFTLTRIPGGLVVAAGGRNASYLSSAERYNVSNGGWGSAGDLGAARSGHAAALLPDARILLVGGSDGTGPAGAMVEYSPGTNTWAEVETGGARVDHTATLLPGGRVLVVGGEQTGWLSDAELVDRMNPSWTTVGTPWGRQEGTAALLPNGKVLVLGFTIGSDRDHGALFDPMTDSWTSTAGAMVVPRDEHTTTLLADGRVLIVGGRDFTGGIVATAEIYDPATDSFSATPGLVRARHHAVLLPDGRVLVAGGVDSMAGIGLSPKVWTPASATWADAGTIPGDDVRQVEALTLLPNGKVLVLHSRGNEAARFAYVFDPGAGDSWRDTWTPRGDIWVWDTVLMESGDVLMLTCGASGSLGFVVYDVEAEHFSRPFPDVDISDWCWQGARAATLADGRVLLAGGHDCDPALPQKYAAVLDPATGITSPLPLLGEARIRPAMALLPDGRVLVSGGSLTPYADEDNDDGTANGAEVLDPWPTLVESWRPTLSSWPAALSMPGSFTLSGTGFRGGAEASGGNGGLASPANSPSVLLRRAEGGVTRWVPSSSSSPWSATSFPSGVVSGLAGGTWRATLFSSGLPSLSKAFPVTACELTTGVLESTSEASVCEGQPLVLSARDVAGATYLWTRPDGSTSSGRVLTIPGAQQDDGGLYTVVATKAGCPSPPDSVLVEVAPLSRTPSITAPSELGGYEEGTASVDLHPGSTYAWSLSAGTIILGQGTNVIRFYAPGTGTSMTVSVVETVGASCVQPTAQKTIALVQCSDLTPTPTNTGPYCAGDTIELTTPEVAGAAYKWVGPEGFTASVRSPTIYALSQYSGSYTVQVRVGTCWSAPATTEVVVNPGPSRPTIAAPASVSQGEFFLASVPDAPGITWSWTVTNGTIRGGAGTREIIVEAGSAGRVTVKVTLSYVATGCASPESSVAIPLEGLYLNAVSTPIVVGSSNVFTGSGFTAGSVIKLFVSTASGPLDTSTSGWTPTSWTPTALTWNIPTNVPLGQGFATLQVVNTDEGYVTSNLVYQHVYGDAADGLPTIVTIGGVGLSAPDPSIPGAHVKTVLTAGSTVMVTGTGFNGPLVNVFTATGNIGPLEPLPGGTATSFQVVIPANAPAGPGSFQVVNSGSGWTVSNAVDAVLRARVTVTSVSVNGSTVTVTGDGFCTLTVINLFNVQGGGVVNLGGLTAGSAPVIPLSNVTTTSFTFTLPAGAQSGPAYVMALNPPFTPFTSSGTDPGGAFAVP